MEEPIITLKNVWKVFSDRAEEVMQAIQERNLSKEEVLEEFSAVIGLADCSFSVKKGEIFCIMGLSGSGKSTIIRHINRLIEPSSGEISVLGIDILSLRNSELRKMRAQHISMVFQHMALLPHKTVRDNVGFPLKIQGESKGKCWEKSHELLRLVQLEAYEDLYPDALSGGMQQRVGLARALASDPEILLMDEPFSALDPLIRRQLQDEFLSLSAKLKKTTVFITHDLDEAMRIGDRIAIMKGGRIMQIAAPEIIVSQPANDYVRDFVEGISKLKLVFASSIMENIAKYSGKEDLLLSPKAHLKDDLEQLIELYTKNKRPILIQNDHGETQGFVTRSHIMNGLLGE
jgi:glycine betaine/proline transport system ATP-binding protein